jgi:hypothetical protein
VCDSDLNLRSTSEMRDWMNRDHLPHQSLAPNCGILWNEVMGRRSWCLPCPGTRDFLARNCFSSVHYGVPVLRRETHIRTSNCMFRKELATSTCPTYPAVRVALSPRFHIPEASEGREGRERGKRDVILNISSFIISKGEMHYSNFARWILDLSENLHCSPE